ncbi:PREDICTED: uncharacterized protein LOC106748827 [Dinoponera quadriceps]|uniref:Uncharacterized protein LOC106748827 n=1 Tax=Dinoponera quadriceps TaxID=609295 RepID=A0A6P3XYN3_DINQU|nr:PREDICTED: uncharacterized protein LOC106748827 [Dinoponera quadriceps]
MERVLAEQEAVMTLINRTIINFKKIGQKNYSSAAARNRLTIVREYWTRCQQLNAEIKVASTTQDRQTLLYFVDDKFSVAEQDYYQASDFLNEMLDKLNKDIKTPSLINSNSSAISNCNVMSIPLPRIELSKFLGLYSEWISFRDLFESLVGTNDNLTNAQCLHYLKTSLTGYTRLVINNITVTDSNYAIAWNA